MALISNIRKRLWIVVVLIGVAMIGFLLQDATSNHGFLSGGKSTVGSINGEKIKSNDFQAELSSSNFKGDKRTEAERVEQTWNQMVSDMLIQQEAEKLGLTITPKELEDLMYGENPSDMIRQAFSDPQTRQFDPTQVKPTLERLEKEGTDEQKSYIAKLKKGVPIEALKNKFNALVSKAVYTPSWMVQKQYATNNALMDVAYVGVPLSAIPDEQVTVTDEDIQKFINDHVKEFDKEPSAAVEYVVFDVKPTSADSAEFRNQLMKIRPDFVKTPAADDSLFIASDLSGRVEPDYKTRKDLVAVPMADSFFSKPVHSVIGPYLDKNAYVMAKVLSRQIVPDSVNCRHILRKVETQEQYNVEKKRLDSIKTEIKAGRLTFAAAAAKFGTDATQTTGGNLTSPGKKSVVPGTMVAPFEDLIFHKANVGELYILPTQFGLHLVEVTKKSASGSENIKVGTISRTIVPSKNTTNAVFQQAVGFVGNNRNLEAFRAAAKAANLQVRPATNLGVNGYRVQGLDNQTASRDLVKWANSANVNDVCKKPFEFENTEDNYVNKYVAVAVTSKKGEGKPSVADVREQVKPRVMNEKKAEMLKSKISGSDLAAIAAQYVGSKTDTIKAMTIQNKYMSALGQEPAVLGVLSKLPVGQTSASIAGRMGVYVVTMLSKTEQPMPDVNMARRQMDAMMSQSASYRAQDALKKAAKIKDYRSDIY